MQGVAHGLASILVPSKTLVSRNCASTEEDGENSWSIVRAAVDGFRLVSSHSGLRGITMMPAVANIPMSAFILLLIQSFQASGSSAFIIG